MMAGLRLNTNVAHHDYDAVTPTQAKPKEYSLFQALSQPAVPYATANPKSSNQHFYSSSNNAGYGGFAGLSAGPVGIQFQQAQQPQQQHHLGAPAFDSFSYPAVQQLSQYSSLAVDQDLGFSSASDIESVSTGPGSPASRASPIGDLAFQQQQQPAPVYGYGNTYQQPVLANSVAYNHLYNSIYNPAYSTESCNNHHNVYQNHLVDAQLHQQAIQQPVLQQQAVFEPAQAASAPSPFLAAGPYNIQAPPSAASSPDTNALYYSSGDESSHTTLSRVSSLSVSSTASGGGGGGTTAKTRSVQGKKHFMGDREERGKKFVCSYPGCSRAFSRNFNLSTHYNTHLGIKPFACTHCTKTFSRRHDRARHISAVHTNAGNGHSKDCACNCSDHQPNSVSPVESAASAVEGMVLVKPEDAE